MKKPRIPPSQDDLLAAIGLDNLTTAVIGGRPVDDRGRYLHWDEMRLRTPPVGLTLDQWWFGTKIARNSVARGLPLIGTNGLPFSLTNVDPIQERVHRIDQQASGQIIADSVVTDLRSSDRYLISSLTEEAITSSQLEGASTTRKVAKELLETGRAPQDRSEQMIVNNLQAMYYAEELSGAPLSPTDVLNLHRLVTDGTLDDPNDAGRLQTEGDDRIAVWSEDVLLHRPPPAADLPARLEAMCDFANGIETDGFIHPVVRAIILHFWLAYDHPFADGNGRTARALFYWAMLRNGYWLTQYISVSSILRKAPVQYATSYLLTETDDNDVTYFVMYQLRVIERAIKSLHEYLGRKIRETREIEKLLHGSSTLNTRQLLVVRDALRDPLEPFTIKAQARRHGVAYESARSDLLGLEKLGLFRKERVGKKFVFHALPDLKRRLQSSRPVSPAG